MIVPDVNLLIYAHNEVARAHDKARMWWEDLVTREQPIGLPWAVAFGFIRLVTHPAVMRQPLAVEHAVSLVEEWLAQDCVRILDPGPRHLATAKHLFAAAGIGASLTTDVHLAALAIEHQAELHSNDTDFARFPGLRWHNPLS